MTTKSLVVAALFCVAAPAAAQEALVGFSVSDAGDTAATIVASCASCDWGVKGRETVFLRVDVDGIYSQHVALLRGPSAESYHVLLGRLGNGSHSLHIGQDHSRSAPGAGSATIVSVDTREISERDPVHVLISRAPVLRARPGTVEHFTDLPLLLYAERDVAGGEGTGRYSLQYTVIFSNEDGGTPTDRLMATWGRTTDIEFVYGLTAPDRRELIQSSGHEWVDFNGPRFNGHPELWVATENNMVADHGDDGAIRFAPLPVLVRLDHTSREQVMDAEPWTYGIAAGELRREGRIDNVAVAGSGQIPQPERYAVLEACAEITNAALSFELGVGRGSTLRWFSSDRGIPAFRIARGGCFRAGVPLPEGTALADVSRLRVRAFDIEQRQVTTGSSAPARATLTRVNELLMIDDSRMPVSQPIEWSGTQMIPVGAEPVAIDVNLH